MEHPRAGQQNDHQHDHQELELVRRVGEQWRGEVHDPSRTDDRCSRQQFTEQPPHTEVTDDVRAANHDCRKFRMARGVRGTSMLMTSPSPDYRGTPCRVIP